MSITLALAVARVCVMAGICAVMTGRFRAYYVRYWLWAIAVLAFLPVAIP